MSQEARRVSIVTRFKNRLRNFRKGLGGFGMIEAALTLPIFLGLTFATIDYGLMMADRNSASGSISSLSRTIQDNPNITAAQLNILVANAGGGNAKFTGTGNCFCAQSFTTQAAAQTFVDGTGCGTGCDSGTRSTGTGTPRYIGVRGQVTYNFITPVNKIFVGESTKVLKFGQVVPVGITICPAGQALTSAGVCAASTVTCGAGQFLTASGTCSAAVPDCVGAGKALQFSGGVWSCASVAMSLSSWDCYWTGAYSGMQAGICGWRGQECAPGYMIASLDHQNDGCDVAGGVAPDDEAFKIKCCRVQLN
jgi:Flp pilus assembly protein TadG